MMTNPSKENGLEFRRKMDGVVYLFHRCEDLPSGTSWKRVDEDVWVTRLPGFGWVTIDGDGTINGRPWSVATDQGDVPPSGEWVSKKGDKSYVYNVVYV
jgi:hypothetical protein